MKSVVKRATITALSAVAIMSATAPAQAGTGTAESVAAPCTSGDFCVWVNTGFTGGRTVMSDRPNGTCYRFLAPPYRSYADYDNIEGYFYSNNNCTGSARAVTAGSEGNIGFNAYSFKYACVSCFVKD